MGRRSALVLAAGKGTRMKSRLPKVMQTLLHEPMLHYVLGALEGAGVDDMAVVVGFGGEIVEQWLAERWPGVTVIWQREQLGTGHALMMAADWLKGRDDVIVTNGDMPMVTSDDFRRFCQGGAQADWSFVTTRLADPTGYGRVIRCSEGVRIVEHKDASAIELAVDEVNVGIYRASGDDFLAGLGMLTRDNRQGEYYIVDLIPWAIGQGKRVEPVELPPETLCGVNDVAELARLTALTRERVVTDWMSRGAKIADPATTWISPRASFDGEVFLEPNVQLWGDTVLGDGCRIGSGCVLTDCRFAPAVICQPYVVARDTTAERGASMGPFCFLRDGAVLAEGAFAGRFVELKNTQVGPGSKVPHLSYMGDATVGRDSNVGAATVTCNYDGRRKHRTRIGDRCFIGSDTMLVAPVNVGDDAMTAAGSVITSDVPSGALGIGRSRQVNIGGWCEKRAQAWNDDRKAEQA